MEDNDYSFGAMEDSSSRVSYDQGSEENGQGGDSSIVMEGGFSESQLGGGDSNSGLGVIAAKADFEWSAARETTEVKKELNGNQDREDSGEDEESKNRKRPFIDELGEEDSESLTEKRVKTEVKDETSMSNSESAIEGIREDVSDTEATEALWTAFDVIKPRIMKSEQLPDLEKFWRPVIESPKDFQAWTSLLQYVDHENDVAAAREAYDSFLRRYPYCYGYWKKWADYEKKKAMKKDCEKVFERGLAAIPLSVDLWLHYLNYCRVHHAANETFVREQFERAMTVCGLEFRSDRLWELYINWEVERDDLRRVFQIYDKLLAVPTQFHTTHWDNFQDLVNQNDPKELLTLEEYEELKLEIFTERKISTEAVADIKLTEEEIQAIRKKTKERRQVFHSKTEKDITDRWAFEEGIKRPYFHVKPLERGQLKNWKAYLEFEIEQGDQLRIDTLFERCLIACALYDEYWLMYAQHLESRWNDELDNRPLIEKQLRSVYRRACTVHVYDKTTLYLMWSNFEEKTGHLHRAGLILDLLEKVAPKFDSLAVRRVNLARRQGDHERVIAYYRKYIETAKKDNGTLAPLSLRASRFAAKVMDDEELAEEFVEKALEKEPRNARLYIQLFDVRFQKKPLDVEACVQALNRALKSKLDLEQRCRFAHRKVEFLEDFGMNVDEISAAQDEYQKLALKLQNDRQAKAAAQMAQQQASATNAPTDASAGDDATKTSKTETSATATTTYTGAYDGANYQGFQGQAGYQGQYQYPGWGGYQYPAAAAAGGWGQQGYYPQQGYGQPQ
ncbi:hypothetical protein GHT06_021480 [Daphnia sinensis]|uniref:Pre-mRNA-processing factor 39 n=1 Tax=Daphnia sinensis TaxID=1820382 RepID=A0AAD5PNQ6_9CRUS|nr:hypothetical protein GHT06_021480 [Daphnia sinensis]